MHTRPWGRLPFPKRSRQRPLPPTGLSSSATDLPTPRGGGPYPHPPQWCWSLSRDLSLSESTGLPSLALLALGPAGGEASRQDTHAASTDLPAGRDCSPLHPLAESHRSLSPRRPGEPRRDLSDSYCFRLLCSEFCCLVIAGSRCMAIWRPGPRY